MRMSMRIPSRIASARLWAWMMSALSDMVRVLSGRPGHFGRHGPPVAGALGSGAPEAKPAPGCAINREPEMSGQHVSYARPRRRRSLGTSAGAALVVTAMVVLGGIPLSAQASSVTSATFTGGAGTFSSGGKLYAKQG